MRNRLIVRHIWRLNYVGLHFSILAIDCHHVSLFNTHINFTSLITILTGVFLEIGRH